jgi:hypothetical protein
MMIRGRNKARYLQMTTSMSIFSLLSEQLPLPSYKVTPSKDHLSYRARFVERVALYEVGTNWYFFTFHGYL